MDTYDALLETAMNPNATAADMRRLEPGLRSDAAASDRIAALRSCHRLAISETLRSFNEEDVHELYRALKVPAVVLRGEQSNVVTSEGASELSRLRPDIPIEVIPGAGHLLHLDAPERTYRAVREFLLTTDRTR